MQHLQLSDSPGADLLLVPLHFQHVLGILDALMQGMGIHGTHGLLPDLLLQLLHLLSGGQDLHLCTGKSGQLIGQGEGKS